MLAVFVAHAAGLLAIRAIWDAGKTEEIEKTIPKMHFSHNGNGMIIHSTINRNYINKL